MKKLKILQTPVRYYPDIGGVENHVYYLSKELIRLGQKVEVVAAGSNNQKALHVDGVIVKRLRTWFKITNTNITLTLPWILLRSDFDIIHTHMPTPWSCDWSILIGKLKGKKTVVTIHNDMSKSSFFSKKITQIYLYSFFIFSLVFVDKIIIVNPAWRNTFINTRTLLNIFSKKIQTVPNGVDTELFRPNLSNSRKRNLILFVSILDEHHRFKGIDYLLKGMRNIKDAVPDVELVIVGEGKLKPAYQQLASKLGVDNFVHFVGQKTQSELAQLYCDAKVFVLPSTEIEGFGIVAIEALACKTPVVCTDIVGVASEIINNRSGKVVPIKNQSALSDAIIDLLESGSRTNSGKYYVSDYFKKKYSWRSIAKIILAEYLSI